MKLGWRILPLLGLSALTGCNPVYSTQPMGLEAATVAAADWEGVWWVEDQPFELEVIDTPEGLLRLSWEEEGKEHSRTVYLRRAEDWILASAPSEPGDPRFFWGRVARQGELLLFWAPSADAFKRLVRDGVLFGTPTSEKGILLAQPSPEQWKQLASGALGVPFEWDQPAVLHRIRSE